MRLGYTVALFVCLCCVAAGCATRGQRYDQYLREARFGEPVSDVSQALGGIVFEECEAGSSLYPYWTLRGRAGSVSIALGAVGPPEIADGLNNLDKLKYVGHFIIQDGNWKSTRWVYTDGLVQDSQEASPGSSGPAVAAR